ncbi:site-specific integrase [Rhodococcus sp. IEGM 1379]|uniref:site-specific integrase n=1 Tax=Rhodococcus sp. IEGM 1379 TaxID=3047086 RepID=UPI0024B7E134|nr:site-specific integrase [Rhodococcus sp. IEGM 1379]MDI9916898.1 site-specific integrase [Rhodococcus sp. IEGM 1379]
MSTTTILDVAQQTLANKQVKATTVYHYLSTLRCLDLCDVPIEQATLGFLHNRLQSVLNPSTRNKHAIALRSMLGVPLKVYKGEQRIYALAPLETIHQTLESSRYRMYAFSMLYAGLRLGESVVKQRMTGSTMLVDRQLLPNGSLSTAKSSGPVVVPDWFVAEYAEWNPKVTRNTVYLGLQRTGRNAGIEVTPHALRHKFATQLVNNGCPPEILRRQLRHHDVQTSLKFYVQTTTNDVEAQVKRAFDR